MAEKLAAYNEKRDFDKTREPKGKKAKASKKLRYVIQHHLARRDHYDLRLEWGGALLSWAVPKGPSLNPADKRLAVEVEPHPLAYRNFEGTIPKGEYGGGTVMLWDEGTWDPEGDVDSGLKEGSLKFTVRGARLKGRWALVRMELKTGEKQANWLLIKERDGEALAEAGISDFDRSVRSGRTMAEIEAGAVEKRNPDISLEPQLAKLVTAIPEDGDWLFEMKYDGYRILAVIEGGAVKLQSRNGNDYTEKFRPVADALAGWAPGRTAILDGEMVIADKNGKTDFQALQKYLKNPKGKISTYILFDLLALDGSDLRKLPLTERKKRLETLLKSAPECIMYSRHVKGKGGESLRAAARAGMEGIIGKRADSPYSGKRSGDWIKLKCGRRQEFVIGGFTRTEKRTSGVSSLLLGYYDGGKLIYAGRSGTGMSRKDMAELDSKFASMTRKTPPFKNIPEPRAGESITWLRPALVAEIKFAEWTDENLLRQASFQGLRTDKDAKSVVREDAPAPEKPGGPELEGVSVSSPDKVLFKKPVITKIDVARYYAAVAKTMLPYVEGRVLSTVRCPKGVGEPCFFRKHPNGEGKGIATVSIPNSDGVYKDYFYIKDAAGLISEVQMGALEFHTWGSRADKLEKPDLLVFDLDPDDGLPLKDVRRGVRDLRGVLSEAGLEAFLKTSGGKGYHVVVPLSPAVSWEVFRGFAKQVAAVMEQKWPDRYTSNIRKEKRSGRIFIDWIRNSRGATSIAPYSIRAREGAAVSMPIGWDELGRIKPDGIKMANALNRINRSDPWRDLFKISQSLK